MSSVGHTEATSGLLSILKTLLVLDSQIIPPNSNLSEINDEIRAFREKKMKVIFFFDLFKIIYVPTRYLIYQIVKKESSF